ncbi:hypothetical protein DRJ19_00185 [Candidatus Woesearchaeota archaeon]|nr:MAG: hypothetical protein DRJ19_00185 [Candidatus Woesearchaeota archaeon]
MKQSLYIGKLAGIKIELHYSWFFIFLLVAWGLASGFFPAHYKVGLLGAWFLGAFASFLLFISILLHEVAHSIVAKQHRIPVHKITLFFFGGVASIGKGKLTPKKEFEMAIAGPLFSILLSLLFFIIYKSVSFLYVNALAFYLYKINLIVALFNLAPGFPLDGGRILRAILWYFYKDIVKATRIASFCGKVFAGILVIGGFIGLFFGGFGLWFIVLGFFLYMVAEAGYEQTVVSALLNGIKVCDLLTKKIYCIDANRTLDELSRAFITLRKETLLVFDKKKYLGVARILDLMNVKKERWAKTKVKEITRKISPVKFETKIDSVFLKMLRYGIDSIPVVKDKRLIGTVEREAIIKFLRLKQILGRNLK